MSIFYISVYLLLSHQHHIFSNVLRSFDFQTICSQSSVFIYNAVWKGFNILGTFQNYDNHFIYFTQCSHIYINSFTFALDPNLWLFLRWYLKGFAERWLTVQYLIHLKYSLDDNLHHDRYDVAYFLYLLLL